MKKKSILIVEDEKIVALDLRSIFQRAGYAVLPDVATSAKAITVALEKKPDVILMDITLHDGSDGIQAAQVIRQSLDIPIIFITANSDIHTLERAKATNPYGYILKPFDEHDVRTTVEIALYKHQSEQKLKDQERWLQTTLRSIGDAVIATDEKGNVKFMNSVAEQLTGWAEHDAIGKKLMDVLTIVHEENEKQFIDALSDILKEKKSAGTTNYAILISKQGERVHIERSVSPILGENGNVIGAVLTFRDITERRKVQEQLRQSEKRFRALIEKSSEGVCILDSAGNLTYITETATRILGYRVDELVGRNAFEFVHPEEVEQCKKVFNELVAFPERAPLVQYRVQHKNGSWVWLELIGTNLLMEPAINGIVINFRDITDRKEAEEQLHQINQRLNLKNNELTQRIEEQQRAEQLLRMSEERYRAFVEQSSEGIYRTAFMEPIPISLPVDEQIRLMFELGYIAECNVVMAKMYGYKEIKDVIGKKIRDLLVETDPHNIEYMRKFIRKGYKFSDEESHEQDKNGAIKYFLNNGMGIVENGMWLGVWGSQRDITERKMAENALRESEERYRTLVEFSPNAIAVHVKGIVQFVNQAAVRLMGATRPEDLIGKPVIDFVHPNQRESVLKRIATVYSNEAVPSQEQQWIRLDGTTVDVEVIAIPFVFEGETAAQVIARDITERKRAEAALRRSEEKYRSLFEESKDGIYISTYDGRFIDVNPAMVELLGYSSKEEMMSLDIKHEVYFNPADREKFLKAISNKLYVKDLELSLRRKDGSEVHVLLTSTVERSDDGTPLFYRGTVRDITERKRLEEQLIQAQKMESIGTLAGGIAHDFNNLLAIILGTAELIQQKVSDNPIITSYIKRIIEASNRGASISRQLLLFSRPEQTELRPLSAAAVIEQLQEFLIHFLPKNISVKTEIEGKSAVIMGDDGHLHQALINLALNARDAMPTGGVLTLGLRVVDAETVRRKFPNAVEQRYVAMSVRDTGTGIEAHLVPRIFEPFFSTKERGKGTGLGLAIVHGIVQLHHGYIDVESERGVGTQFTIYFPLLPIEVHHESPEHTVMKQHNSGTILVVDDEEILREILGESLREEGFEVLLASDGYEALSVYQQYQDKISLVITDLGMPNMGGEQLFEKLKELNPDIKVIVSSGYLDTSSKSDLLRKGIREVLTKPYKFDVIVETVRRVLSIN